MIDLDAWLDSINPIEGAKWTPQRANDLADNGLITGFGNYNYNDGAGGLSDDCLTSRCQRTCGIWVARRFQSRRYR
jgi:hypothetical protein